jgi:hypothetical protein
MESLVGTALQWADPTVGRIDLQNKTASPGSDVLGIESYSCILLATRNGNQQESNIAPVAAVTKVTLDAQVLR